MIFYCRNDFGTMQVSFAGLSVHLCDDASLATFERIKKFLRTRGDLFSLDYYTLTSDGVVSVYTLGEENFMPTLTFSIRHLFTDNKSFLLRLYNLFASKRRQLRYEADGKPIFGSVKFHNGSIGLGYDVFHID